MALIIVDRVATPVQGPALAALLADAYRSELGRDVPADRLRFALAHVGVENDSGRAIYNGNLGFISATEGTVFESPAPSDPEQPSYFRAFASVEAGAQAYWALMRARYRAVWPALSAGGVRFAAAVLLELGWCHRCPDYVAAIAAAWRSLPGAGAAWLLAPVAGAAAVVAWEAFR